MCSYCESQISYLPTSHCSICCSPIDQDGCKECESNNYLFKQLICVGSYDGILKNLIYRFKYDKQYGLAFPLAELLFKKCFPKINKKNFDFIIPIPLHLEKEKVRGYNQTELISIVLSNLVNLPMLKVLERIKFTSPQYFLNKQQRLQNLKDAFVIKPNYSKIIKEKNLILIDDIFTTGSTINEATRVLLNNGVNEIVALTLAKTLKHKKSLLL